jgi:hypothetical protein
MFIIYAIAAGLVVGLAAGGRPSALADIQFRWGPLFVIGFLAQVLLFSDAVASRIGDLGPVFYVASTLVVVIAVLRNLDLPGIRLVVCGAVCNIAAIVSNGGYMPATPEALATFGRTVPTIYSNSAVVASPNLPLLIDRFAMPRWVPFANVFSAGDVLLSIGVFVLLVVVMRRARHAATPTAPTTAEPA